MKIPRISASSYLNTAPLIWSFLFGSRHGSAEVILDNAPARSSSLLAEGRVDAALVPVVSYHSNEAARLVPDVCVGARERVRSVCLLTRGKDLGEVRSVCLDASSRTSVVLTKIIFREFLGHEPEWSIAEPDPEMMLSESECALLIGDPALLAAGSGGDGDQVRKPGSVGADLRVFDLVEVWRRYTDLGFVFAMWMTNTDKCPIGFAEARDEGIEHLSDIISNFEYEMPFSRNELSDYLTENVCYSLEDDIRKGMDLFFRLALKQRLIERARPLVFTND